MSRRAILLLLVVSWALPSSARQQILTVRVEGFHSELPLAGAWVQIERSDGPLYGVAADPDGIARLYVSGVATETLPTAGFSIGSPYPQPGVDRVRVPVTIDRAGPAVVTLFDVLGRRLASLTDELAATPHELVVDGAGLASGAYFVQVSRPGRAPATTTLLFSNPGQRPSTSERRLAWEASRGTAGGATQRHSAGDPTTRSASKAADPEAEYILRITHPGHFDAVVTVNVRYETDVTIRMTEGLVNSIGMGMVRLPAGAYIRGQGGATPHGPAHPVRFARDLLVSRTEVTSGQWNAVNALPPETGPPDRPKANVTWLQAVAYANLLSEREGFIPCYDAAGRIRHARLHLCDGYRLPTEAEWEYAARAGTTTLYFWGDDSAPAIDYAWYKGHNPSTCPGAVGALAPNAWNVFDTAGNVREWVSDVYGDYRLDGMGDPIGDGMDDPARIPDNPASGYRIIRGGSCSSPITSLQSAIRAYDSLNRPGTDLGFRLVRSVNPMQTANRPPDHLEAVAPVPGGAHGHSQVTLEWSATDPDGDSMEYVVYVGLDGRLGRHRVHVAEPRLLLQSVPAETVVSWKVIAWDGHSFSESATWTFTSAGRGGTPYETRTTRAGIELARIPAGTFTMGADGGQPDSRPPHAVTLTHDFWLGRFEVTASQYDQISTSVPQRFDNAAQSTARSATILNWITFLNRLSTAEGLVPCYDASGAVLGPDIYACDGYRLVTEAEWEYAARAGTVATWSFGDDPSEFARHGWAYPAVSSAQPVGLLAPNPWGLYDVHGNLWELTNDWYAEDAYSVASPIDPMGPATGSARVARGGSASATVGYSTSAYRMQSSAVSVGLRVVRTAH